MATGGIPRGIVNDPPREDVTDAPGRSSTAYMEHRGDPPGFGMDNPGPDYEGDHRHKRHCPVRYHVESGVGADIHSPTRQPTDVRRPPRVQDRKRDGEGYQGVKALPRAVQNRPGPPFPGIPGP